MAGGIDILLQHHQPRRLAVGIARQHAAADAQPAPVACPGAAAAIDRERATRFTDVGRDSFRKERQVIRLYQRAQRRNRIGQFVGRVTEQHLPGLA